MRKKGFTLLETIITGLIVSFVLSGTFLLISNSVELNRKVFFEENTQDFLGNLIYMINKDIRNGSEVKFMSSSGDMDGNWSLDGGSFTKRIEIEFPNTTHTVRYSINKDSSLYRITRKDSTSWNTPRKLNLESYIFDLDSSGFEYDGNYKRCYVKLKIEREKGRVKKDAFMKSYVTIRN
ncbi:MAG: hypothetical protein CR982_09020 [Candidatus Cloacimonadota bacterium]|nr:MAG: hypothetical protein CR982_09020 [Candidatus Cloacimonadota bacterium]PIE78607.1 MAG: hypothetical protein CSA15_06915 [Candidatus Delongbacteria bacterium]